MWLHMPEGHDDLGSFLSSLEREEGCSRPSGCWAGEQSGMSKTTSTASASSSSESRTGCSTTRPSGTTQGRLTGDPGVDAWIPSRRASRASRSAGQAKATAQQTSETSGRTPFASLEKCGPDGFYWKMCQGSFVTVMPDRFTEAWPKAGMMLDGIAYLLPRLDWTIGARGGGLLPTPTANDGPGYYVTTQRLAQQRAKRVWGPSYWAVYGTVLHALKRGWANPRFSEAMMGWPIGWTDLEPLGMGKFQEWLQQFGGC